MCAVQLWKAQAAPQPAALAHCFPSSDVPNTPLRSPRRRAFFQEAHLPGFLCGLGKWPGSPSDLRPHPDGPTALALLSRLNEKGPAAALGDAPASIHHRHPESTVRIGVTGVYHLWLWTNVHHYSITQSRFTAPKTLPAPPVHRPRPLPRLLGSADLVLSVALRFLEHQITGITHCVAFSDRLLPFGGIHLRFLRVFSWRDGSFL